MIKIILAFIASTALVSLAHAGVNDFKDFKSMTASDFYYVTCSGQDTNYDNSDVHVRILVKDGQLDSFKFFNIVPAKSILTRDLRSYDLAQLKLDVRKSSLGVVGSIDTGYYPTEVYLRVWQTKNGMEGFFSYDDNDGLYFDGVKLKCGGTTY